MVIKVDEIRFSSLEELYKRLKPALSSKKKELNKLGYVYIKEEDIWNALKNNKWTSSLDLSLYDMVDDILNTANSYFDDYVKEELRKQKRTLNLNEDIL